jgi:hypothetical protein
MHSTFIILQQRSGNKVEVENFTWSSKFVTQREDDYDGYWNRPNKDTKKAIRTKVKGRNQWENSEQDASFRHWERERTKDRVCKKQNISIMGRRQ